MNGSSNQGDLGLSGGSNYKAGPGASTVQSGGPVVEGDAPRMSPGTAPDLHEELADQPGPGDDTVGDVDLTGNPSFGGNGSATGGTSLSTMGRA